MTQNKEFLDVEPDPEVKEAFAEAEQVNLGSQEQLIEKLEQHTETSPILSAGDIDANWEDADDVGDEGVGGSSPTPDQDIVEEIGEALGVTFQDNEPLDVLGKLEKRDEDRWELNPASADK
ncbi:MAG: hypothetical protein KF756_06475 [Acidobacteria bacterium]|nr:hypothetical protein [Acidobacteriota bacterium]